MKIGYVTPGWTGRPTRVVFNLVPFFFHVITHFVVITVPAPEAETGSRKDTRRTYKDS
jgi:hypothetical protein